MQTLRVDIINPKAMQLLRDLAEMKLISITPKTTSFSDLLKKLRSKASKAPSLEEITKEVELVRAKRYGK